MTSPYGPSSKPVVLVGGFPSGYFHRMVSWMAPIQSLATVVLVVTFSHIPVAPVMRHNSNGLIAGCNQWYSHMVVS